MIDKKGVKPHVDSLGQFTRIWIIHYEESDKLTEYNCELLTRNKLLSFLVSYVVNY